ncbi:MAG: transketolase [Nitrospinae bacterium]|nr:transketolase [Nitrospinota bacterium]
MKALERTDDVAALSAIARDLRIDILTMLNASGSGHSGGSLSAIDILTALYFSRMDHSPLYPRGKDRDRFVLSKGHAAPALYAALARAGYFDRSHLLSLRKLNAMLSGHPFAPSTPGVEISTGSLGQGLSLAVGMALAGRLDGWKKSVFAMTGDGELQEGQVWEAAMAAAHYKLDNLVAFVDHNGLQIDGAVAEVMGVDPVDEKFAAFGWATRTVNGHDMAEILDAIDWGVAQKGKPSVIVAMTVKGKGVSFMEGKASWHGTAPSDEQLAAAIAELTLA